MRHGAGPAGVTVQGNGTQECVVHPGGPTYPLDPCFWDVEARLGAMDAAGIDAAVVSIAPPLFLYSLPAREAAEYCASMNAAAARLTELVPKRLRALATLPMGDPMAAADELRSAVSDLGLVGAEIGTNVGACQLDHPRLDPVWAAAEELRVPVMVHPHRAMVEGPPAGMERYHLANLIGNPVETTVAAARLMLGGVFDRYPQLRVLLVHGGGFLPFQLGRIEHGYSMRADVAEGAAHSPAQYIDNLLFDTVLFDRSALDFLLAGVGRERVLFGTDSPFDMADQLSLKKLDPAGPGFADVLGGNALRVFAGDGLR